MKIKIFNALLMLASISFIYAEKNPSSAPQLQSDPAALFDYMLKRSEPDDIKTRTALANLFKDIPTNNDHELKIKQRLAEKFYSKYDSTIEEAAAYMEPTEEKTSTIYPWLVGGGTLSTILGLLWYILLYGREQALPPSPKVTSEKRAIVEALPHIQRGRLRPRRPALGG